MKINVYVEDLKKKSAAELNNELVAAKKELFNLRFQITVQRLPEFRLLSLKRQTLNSNLERRNLSWKETLEK